MAADPGIRIVLTSRSGEAVPVRLRVDRRARRVSVRIDPRAHEAVATAPSPRRGDEALLFARSRVDWLAERLSALPASATLAPGSLIPFRGAPHRLEATGGPGRVVRIAAGERPGDAPRLLTPGAPDAFAARILAFLRAAARADLAERVAAHAARLGTRPRSLSVKDTRSRWGSCSVAGALSFSWRLVCAPPEVLDYVAAHEVAHLREMNHSPRFWSLVAECCPDWRRHRRWLKEHGSALLALGGG